MILNMDIKPQFANFFFAKFKYFFRNRLADFKEVLKKIENPQSSGDDALKKTSALTKMPLITLFYLPCI